MAGYLGKLFLIPSAIYTPNALYLVALSVPKSCCRCDRRLVI